MSSVARLLLTVLLAWSGAAPFALAQDDGPPPPDRAGRISAIEGRMTYKNADDQDWSEASLNYPVASGMSFATAPGARAELELGGTTLRLDGRTATTIAALENNATTITAEDGSIDIRPRILFDDEKFTIEAAHARISLLQAGAYRIDSGLGSEPTRVTVFQGRAELETSHGREEVRAGDAVEANAAGLVRHIGPYPTEVDSWAEMRENARTHSPSQQYVGDEMPGYEDLDNTGTWQQSADYGAVWYPNAVPLGWEPYAFGQWVWVSPWGWTWVDDQPWGFAPFHYGRWVYFGGRWGWSPGERLRRPVYAPALVAFVGSDPWRFHSRGVRPSHWVPLAPGEAYRAPYTRNVAYLKLVNRGFMRPDALDKFDWRGQHNDFANDRNFHSAAQNFPRVHNASVPRPPVIADPGRGDRNERGERTIGRGRDPGGNAGNAPAGNRPGNRGFGATPVAPTPSQPNYTTPNTNGVGQFSRAPGAPLQPLTNAPGAPAQPATNVPGAPAGTQFDGRGTRAGQGAVPTPGNGRFRRGTPNPGQPQDGNDQPNVGQGNLGQGNLGQGNLGQPTPGGAPDAGAGRGRARGGEGRGRD